MRQIGIIATIFERLFHLLKFLPPQVFVEERTKHQKRLQSLNDADREKAILNRLKITEGIILVYVLIYFISYFLLTTVSSYLCLKYIVLTLLALRLIDIIQVNVNISIFDNLKIDKSKYPVFVYSSIRSIILVCLNFIEIAIIFGFFYSLITIGHFESKSVLTSLDKFYFSFITQLTIGYGDITPVGFNKLLSVIQGLIGYFFTILILSRFINILPLIKSEKN